LRDADERQRIRALAIPPAYEKVWICSLPNGHLQATGIDQRGRKQYRYHASWQSLSADRKFEGITEFARAIPLIRSRVAASLGAEGFVRDRIVAGIVGLLDHTGYRIGNKRYVKENHSYGLTSLLSRHLFEEEGGWTLRFKGKSGRMHNAQVRSARIATLMAELHELPGQHLFRYEDDAGQWHDVGTSDVNEWLKNVGGGEFSAKQFRTWRASVLCARELAKAPAAETEAGRRRAEMEAIRHTAERLHHTPATCRKYYVHPAIFESYRNGRLHQVMNRRPPRFPAGDKAAQLRAEERRLLWLIEHREKPGRTKREKLSSPS